MEIHGMTRTNWFEKAMEELEESRDSGEITEAEFSRYVKELYRELRESGDYDQSKTVER